MKTLYLIILIVFSLCFCSCDVSKFTFDVGTCTNNGLYNDVITIQYNYGSSDTYVIGNAGLVQYLSTNNGCSFQDVASNTTQNLKAVSGDVGGIVIVGSNGTVLKGSFFPTTLSLISSGTGRSLNAVIQGLVEESFIAVGDSGTIIKSTDNGSTWYSVPSGRIETFYEIESYRDGSIFRLYISGYNGVVLLSEDNGETWTLESPIVDEGLSSNPVVIRSLQYIDNNTGWAAGNDGKIFKTTNGGNFWSKQITGISQTINKILFNTFLYGYAAADSGRILFTTNGGTNWLPHPTLDTVTRKNIYTFSQSDSVSFIAVGDSTIISVITDQATSPLAGTIPVGPGGEFTEVNTAVSAAAFLGVKDSVRFNIEPGTYNEKIVISQVLPAESKMIINGNNAVELAKDMTDTSNFTLKISSAKNVVIENLTISNLDTSKGRIVLFEGAVSNVVFKNVVFNGPYGFVTSFSRSLVTSDGFFSTKLTNVEFVNCTFNKGSFGIRFFASGINNYFSGLKISNCMFRNATQSSVALNFHENFMITGNTIDSSLGGFALSNSRNFEVSKNKVYTLNASLSLQSTSSTGQNRNLIANNFFVSNAIGLFLIQANSNNDFYHNSFNIQSPYDTSEIPLSSNISPFFFSGSNNNLRNNIFSNKRGGLAVSINSGTPFTSINYNDYHTNGDTLALWITGYHMTLNSFKAASGRDTNSVSQNVSFDSPVDLHLSGASNGDTLLKSLPLASVTTDIDGSMRSLTSPYMGADEGTVQFGTKVMNLNIKFEAHVPEDVITVELRNSISPFNLIESKNGIGGKGIFKQITFNSAINGTTYYLKVTHRNSIETWSSGTPAFSNDSITYNFTTSISQAFGNNMIIAGGTACFYGGDANQDGAVDATDLLNIYNDANNFVSGYIPTDINGDGYTDTNDLIFAYNNSAAFVSVMRP